MMTRAGYDAGGLGVFLEHLERKQGDLGGMLDAYQEVARRLGVLNENDPAPTSGPRLVKG